MKSKIFVLAFISLFILSSFALPAATPIASFQGLGFYHNTMTDLSDDGLVVVGDRIASPFGNEAYRWTAAEGVIGLGDLYPGGSGSFAQSVSADGSIIVGYCGYSYTTEYTIHSYEAFSWTAETGMVGLGDLPGGDFLSQAYGVSPDGSVIVGVSRSPSGSEAFRWTSSGGMQGLGDLSGGLFDSFATCVSADGSVVAGRGYSSSGQEAFRWSAQTGMVGLGDLPGGDFLSYSVDVSADGSIIAGYSKSTSGYEAFRWTSETGMVGLGDLPGGNFYSVAESISADGSVIVGYSVSDSGGEAFYWTADEGMQSLTDILKDAGLDLTGWSLKGAIAVSADGFTIFGRGTNPNGYTEAWIATIPEPATITLLCFGFLIIRKFDS